MAEHPVLWPKEGLSPGEAYSRTLSPSLKAHFRPRQRRILSLGFDASENDRRLLKMSNANEDRKDRLSDTAKWESISAFHSYLREGLLVATGHKTKEDAIEFRIEGHPAPMPIRREAWASLHIHWHRGSAGKRKEPERFDLKIFPLLNSPLALEMLQGLTLPEAFTRYIAGDPELKAAEEAAGVDAGPAAWRPNYHPLFDRIGIFWRASTLYPEAIENENPSGVLHEDSEGMAANYVARARVAALFGLLRERHLEAVGVDSNGDEKLLPRSFWLSQKGYIDFKDGEAFTLNETGEPVPVASGISLRRKEVVASAAAPTTDKDWVVHDLGRLPRPTKGEKFKEYVARAWAANLDWRAAIKTRGVAAKIADAMIDAAGATWEKETLADEIRGHSENREKSAAKKAVPRNDRDLHIARLRSSRPSRK